MIGGGRLDGRGYFFEPTVLTDVARRRAAAEGGDLRPGRTGEGLRGRGRGARLANDTDYGLVAYVYTRDLGAPIRVMEGLEYGMVGVNQGMVSNPAAPFGGVKQSGFGREGGYEGIQEYLETKYCAITP